MSPVDLWDDAPMTIEQRVDRLETDVQELQHVTDARVRALGTAVSAVHTDVLELRAEVKRGFNAVNERLDGVDRTLATILERLPAPPAAE